MSKAKYIVTGFVVGGVVSAAITLLTTPTSGEQLRTRVREQGTDWMNTVEDILKDAAKIKEQFAKTSKEGIALINELTEDMKSSVDEWKNSVEPHQSNIHEYLEQIESTLKDLEQKITDSNTAEEN
ncbi:MAG TPA: YtxH domain-containing protein [Pseudogracilibacillus sp.]|nr:YtxH domain-containing protein [Pseudogracilibacillus sp.]